MKVLHLASFTGNIGDVANHESFYYNLKKMLGVEIEVTKLEIRDYYLIWNNKKFDNDFVELVNKNDLFIIGGGNLFELCWEYSSTGTTINITNEQLDEIKTPILINAVGIDDNKGISKENIEKFSSFIGKLREKNALFTVRNDGSFEVVEKYFSEYKDYIIKVLDNGFYLADIIDCNHVNKQSFIGFNIANDMSNLRYNKIAFDEFIEAICKNIELICEKTSYKIMMFPHIYSDFEVIFSIMNRLDNQIIRTRFSVAPLIHGLELDTFNYYLQCKAVFSMRFHSNVCAMALDIPVIPILTYPKHIKLYEELEALDYIIDVNNSDFICKIKEYTNNLCGENLLTYKVNKSIITQEKNKYFNSIRSWLKTVSSTPKEY